MEQRGMRASRHAAVRMPWHGWLLGAVFLLYGLAAAFDHVMSLALGAEFYRASGMSEAQVAYFSAVPAWALCGWTLSVWAGLAAALGLLARRTWTIGAFALSLLGSLTYALYVLVLSDGREAMGMLWAMPLVLMMLTGGMIGYSRLLARRGVLR